MNTTKDKNISTAIGDVIRWILALNFIPVVCAWNAIALLFTFQYLLQMTTEWKYIWHLLSWIPLMYIPCFIGMLIHNVFGEWFLKLPRHKKVAKIIYSALWTLIIIAIMIQVFFGSSEFDWESYKYATTNKIIFCLVCLFSASVPFIMFGEKNSAKQDDEH